MVRQDAPLSDFPTVTKQLLDALQKHFPIRLPRPGSSERDDLYFAGQRSVVEFLEQIQEFQASNALEAR